MSNKKKRMAAQRRKEALKSAPAAPKGQKEESVKVNPEQPKKVPTKNKVKIAAACLVCAAVIYGAGTLLGQAAKRSSHHKQHARGQK